MSMYFDLTLYDSARFGCSQISSGRAGDAVRRAIERLRMRFGLRHENRAPVGNPMIAALAARLESIESEIDRLTRLASQEQNVSRQEQYLALARDLNREAREIRKHLR